MIKKIKGRQGDFPGPGSAQPLVEHRRNEISQKGDLFFGNPFLLVVTEGNGLDRKMEEVTFLESSIFRDSQNASPVHPCRCDGNLRNSEISQPLSEHALSRFAKKTQPTFWSVCLQNWDDLVSGTLLVVPED